MVHEKLTFVLAHNRTLKRLGHTLSLLTWDQQVYMPQAAGGIRGEQLSTLAGLHHAQMTNREFVESVEMLAQEQNLSPKDRTIIRELAKDVRRATKVPGTLVQAMTEAESACHERWLEARHKRDFSVVRDELRRVLELKREYAACLSSGDPYDTLLDIYEPGAKSEEVGALFSRVRPELTKLATGKRTPKLAAKGLFPRKEQLQIFEFIARKMGFDFQAGRIDETIHPFCTDIGPRDVRLTTRIREDDLHFGLFGLIHETGHGLYEQGFLPENYYTPLAEAASLGIHESQSLFWEKQVGRHRDFWRFFYPKVLAAFPEALAGISEDDFYRSTNRVEPGFIRIEADEVTYGLHVIIRFELESAFIRGELPVDDLSGEWNKRYEEYLGITPPNELLGVLQDTHWYSGLMGYFPTYLLGAMYAAQLFAAFAREHDAPKLLSTGNLLPAKEFLRSRIHRFGREFSANELMKRSTGQEPHESYFLNYLRGKFGGE